MSTQIEVDLINGQIQKQLNQKIAALQGPSDTVLIQSKQSQVDQLTTQVSSLNAVAAQFSANGNVFSDISNRLAAMQTAIANGNSQGFDGGLQIANNDVANLIIVTPPAPFQPTNIEQLKTNGLAIKSSAFYDLSTAAGKAAAQADVQAAQDSMLQTSGINTSNQLIAFNNANAVTTQINTLNTSLQEMQSENQDYITAQTNQLTQLAQNQEHLIQLALGNTTTLSTALQQMTTPVSVASSPFDVLDSSSTSASASSPAILSLLT